MMKISCQTLIVVLSVVFTATTVANGTDQDSDQVKANQPEATVVLASEVEWQQLNPKRGDRSPQAATLWGDRNGTQATGFLVKFVDGFSSPTPSSRNKLSEH